MLASERLMYIKQQLDRRKVLNLRDITSELNVSESTIRRDFEELEKQGVLKRVHGGVIKAKMESILSDTMELTMDEKAILNMETKKKICYEASKLVKDGNCVFVDGVTSLMYMLDYLCDKNVKIVTHSVLNVHNILNSKAEIIVIGGKYIPNYKINVGPISIETMEKFNFDYSFIGCTGIDLSERTVFTADMETAAIKQIAIKNALSSYLLIDSSKLDVRGFYKFSDLNSFDAVFTDEYPDDAEKIENVVVCKNN